MKRAKNGAWSGSPSRRSRFTRCDTHRNHFLIYPRRPINMDVDDSEFLPDETDENPDRVWWPRLSQFRSVGVRDFLAFTTFPMQIGGCPRLSRQLSHSLAARTRQWDERSFRDLSRRSRRVSSRMVCLAWYRADHDARVLDVLREKDEDRAAWIRRGGARSTSGSVHGNPIG